MKVQYVSKEGNFEFHDPFTVEHKLPAGVYRVDMNRLDEIYLRALKIETETLIELPNSPTSYVMHKIDNFLTDSIRKAFDRYGILYKRGILLYGPPGTGKTSVVNQIINLAVKKDMIIFYNAPPDWIRQAAEFVREIEKDNRPIMVIWEEFESWIDNREDDILSLLDGISQINNIVYLATTNYIDKIPERIRNRPSRFADVVEVGYPNGATRKKFFESKIRKEDKVNIAKWVEETEGLSIDHLKDLIISVLVLGISFEDAIEKMRNLPYDTNDKRNDRKSNYIDVRPRAEMDACSPPKVNKLNG